MDNNVLSKLTTGMFVVTSAFEDKTNAFIANSLVQVASEPTVLSLSVFGKNFSKELIQNSKKFNVSILSTDATIDFIRALGYKSGRDVDKLAKVKFTKGENGVPAVTQGACGYLECEVINEIDLGSCIVFFAKLTNAVYLDSKDPMTSEYYQKALEGKLPPSSPGWSARYVKEK